MLYLGAAYMKVFDSFEFVTASSSAVQHIMFFSSLDEIAIVMLCAVVAMVLVLFGLLRREAQQASHAFLNR